MNTVVRLTASATRALPRWALLALCVIYAAAGLFGRDPWKNEDAAGFGVMWTLAHGHLHDWLLPNLFGQPAASYGPLAYWLGALSIRLFSFIVDPDDASRVCTGLLFLVACAFTWYGAYLLGRRSEIQPFKYAFGGEPLPRDYGRTLGDGALLILVGCFGLAERGHETTPQITQFACVAVVLYGLIRGLDKPIQGALWWGAALGLVTFAGNPVLGLVLAICTTVAVLGIMKELDRIRMLAIGLPLALLVAAAWPIAVLVAQPSGAGAYLHDWALGSFDSFGGPPGTALLYALKNLPLFTWPAWPLALWSWWSWGGLRRAPHIVAPISVIGPLLFLVVLQNQETNRLFMLLLPPLSVLAAFALPTLKRGAINAIDWFALLSFTIIGSFVWIVWLAGLTGLPRPIARNLARLVPGFHAEFDVLSFITAVAITACWIALVQWRLARHPKVLWRSVVLSSAGTTLMWVLLMTLWLPLINYSRTYRDVATQIAAHLPVNYRCVRPERLGDAQIASFGYFAGMRFGAADAHCDVLLRQDSRDVAAPAAELPFHWKFVWEGRRAADRDERFRLYVQTTDARRKRH